jgi:hypothetical protein
MSEPAAEAKPLPRCKAILLCEKVIVDRVTGQSSIIGILDAFRLTAYPGRMRPFNAFLQLVDGIGKYHVVVEIHYLQMDRMIARSAGFGIDFPQRLCRLAVTIPIPAMELRYPGRYDVVVLANDQEIDRQQFIALEARPRAQGESPS